MHIPDMVLAPSVLIATTGVGAVGFASSLRKLEAKCREKTVALMGMMAAFLFAAQMVNFPVFFGVSGHLLGGTLAAVLLGPWAGASVVGAVLIVQCFLFGDGGVTALGANFVNMGLVGALGGYAIYVPIRRLVGGRAGILIGAMVAAWLSVILAAGAFAVELAAGGRGSFPAVLGLMTIVHAVIGMGEAVITGVVVRFVLLTRPDLIDDPDATPSKPSARWGQVAVAGLAVALAVAVFAAPFASSWPDGLEHVGAKLGFVGEGTPPVVSGLLPEYRWEILGPNRLAIATAAAGTVGTMVVFAVALAMARTFVRRDPGGIGPDAA
jgi:cobalt/nickel transport system permease protein